MTGKGGGRPIVVAIPARDEAVTIGGCLTALSRQTWHPTAVVLLLNNCIDATERIASSIDLPFHLEILSVSLPAAYANAGTARRLAMDHAAKMAGETGIVMTTDADAVVPPEWVALNMRALNRGADVVCGRALIDPQDATAIPDHLHADDALECQYGDLLDAMAETLCPDPADPWPRHTEASGASLAMSVVAFLDAGGVPHVLTGEDRALVAALRRRDARIRHDPALQVVVSGRTVGRAMGGMADAIRRRMVRQDEFTDACLEPPGDAFRRADFQRRLRWAWSGFSGELNLAADLHLPSAVLDRHLQAPFFGFLWDEIERLSPMLPRRRVRFADLPRQIQRARGLLALLKGSRSAAASDQFYRKLNPLRNEERRPRASS